MGLLVRRHKPIAPNFCAGAFLQVKAHQCVPQASESRAGRPHTAGMAALIDGFLQISHCNALVSVCHLLFVPYLTGCQRLTDARLSGCDCHS